MSEKARRETTDAFCKKRFRALGLYSYIRGDFEALSVASGGWRMLL